MRQRTFIIASVLTFASGLAYAQDKAPAAAAAKPADAKPAAPAKKEKEMSPAAEIKLAESAGPADIAKDAMIMHMDADGKNAKTLREGKNGWMCMAKPEVMCLDKTWQAWADSWLNHKPVTVTSVGVAYMLRGDQGASNTDPYAMEKTADNNWIVSPPHIMVLSPDTKLIDSLPTDPNTGGPWVMWKGTPYAHIMVPTTAMPKVKAAAPAKAPAPAK
jgi:hypothetical protein